MQADKTQVGYQLIDRDNPGSAVTLNDDIRLGNAYADALHKCEAEAAKVRKPEHRTLDVLPAAQEELLELGMVPLPPTTARIVKAAGPDRRRSRWGIRCANSCCA